MGQPQLVSSEIDIPDLEEIVAQCLSQAAEQGASQADADASVETGLSVTVRHGEVETIESQRDRSLGVTVWFGHRKGAASTTDLSAAAIEETVRKAGSIARFTTEDECSGLADAERMASDYPDLDLNHPWNLGPAGAIDLATECEAAALAHDARINNSEGATVSSYGGMRVYGNSHGFVGGRRGTSHSVSCSVLAGQAGEMQRDYWYSSARAAADLMDAPAIGDRAAQRALARLGSRKIDTCQAPVLYPAELARGLVSHLVSAVRGTAQYREASYLAGAAGSQVTAAGIDLYERPHMLKGVGSASFDAEGVATRDRDLVVDGVLQGYVLSSYSARKLGLQTTGNAGGVHNLELAPGNDSFDALVAGMNRGLVLCELIGHGVNIVNGDYSRGAAGFWVENGEIVYPVHEVTIAGNLKDLFGNIIARGNDLDTRSSVRAPSLLIGEMTIAGN